MKYLIILFNFLAVISATAQTNPEEILLKDYHPVSIYNIKETKVDKAKFPVIDMHTHPYPKSLQELNAWVINMNDVGVSKCIVMTYAHGNEFDSLVEVFNKYPDRFELWCGIDYSGYNKPGYPEKAIKELERCYKEGARGVGELGDKGKGLFYSKPEAWGMHSDDDRMIPVFSKCAELHMPVNIHVADPMWMYKPMDETNDGLMNAYSWRLDNKKDIVDHEGMIEILENTVRKNPGTTFIACHLANCTYDLSRIGRLLDKYDNLYIDIAARYAELAPIPRNSHNFIIQYQDRIVYGTDMGYAKDMYRLTFRILETDDEHFYDHNHSSYHWSMNGLDLPDEVLEKIYYKNAGEILRRD